MIEIVKQSGVGPMSEETKRVMARLQETEVGDVVSWEEIEMLAGRPRGAVRQMVITARNRLEQDYKMHFRTLPSMGVERIDHTTVAREIVPLQRKRIGGAARKMARTTRNVILNEMSIDDRNQVLIHQTVAELTLLACSNKAARQLTRDFAEHRELTPFTPREAAQKLFAG